MAPNWSDADITDRRPRPRGGRRKTDNAIKPLNTEPEMTEATRSWSVPAIAALAIITALVVGLALLGNARESTSGSDPASATIELLSVQDFDPLGDNRERSDLKDNAIDNDNTSAWQTERYTAPNFGNGLKEGVGLIVDLNSNELGSISLDTQTSNWSMDIYVADSFGDDPASWGVPAAQIESATGSVATEFSDTKPKGKQVLLWITDHGSTDRENLFRLNEVTISE